MADAIVTAYLTEGRAAAWRLLLRSRPLRVLTEPAVAAVLDVGGLWLLYATPLRTTAAAHPVLDLVVHAHVLLAGYLFTAVLVGRDPLPPRRGTGHRLVVLVLALAAHDVLAKWLYAHADGADAGAPDEGPPTVADRRSPVLA